MIQNDTEIIDHRVPIRFHHLDHTGNHSVQFLILMADTVILPGILYSDRISQLVISQKITVAVIDMAAGSLHFLCLLYLQLVIIQIFLSFNDLKIEYPLDENRRQSTEHNDQDKYPRLKNIGYSNFDPFP